LPLLPLVPIHFCRNPSSYSYALVHLSTCSCTLSAGPRNPASGLCVRSQRTLMPSLRRSWERLGEARSSLLWRSLLRFRFRFRDASCEGQGVRRLGFLCSVRSRCALMMESVQKGCDVWSWPVRSSAPAANCFVYMKNAGVERVRLLMSCLPACASTNESTSSQALPQSRLGFR
jgi:hypothetical protein